MTLGIGLGETFKTFDIFKNGIATSIKSIDLNSPSYLNPAKNVIMLNNMRIAIRATSNFESYGSGVKILNSSKIHTRIVNFVVNDIPMNQSQIDKFKRAMDYAKELGVEVQITIIK